MTGGFARTIQTYLRPERLPTIWCQGCGNGIVIGALIRALAGSGVRREDVVVVSGIGCSGRASGYLNLPGFQPTHGRALPFATGVKIANPSLTVIAIMGDGDCLSIGGNHFLHAARRNLDITALVLNNSNYGMTGGQYAPTTPKGGLTTTTPYGNAERAVDISALAQVAGATYVARSTSYHALELSGYIKRALLHRGFSVVEALCHCPTQYGKMNRLGSPVNMLKLQRDLAVSQARAASMPAGELAGRIITGEMVKPEGQGEEDYTTAYARVIERAMEKAMPVEETQECIPSPSGGYWEFRLSGSGGQGLVLAGLILAEAAGVHEGRHVVQARSYGPEARGGASRSEVIISGDPIDLPEVTAPDLVLAMTQEAFDRYQEGMKAGATLIVDPRFVRDTSRVRPGVRLMEVPLTGIAEGEAGHAIAASIVALGVVAGLTRAVSEGALARAISHRVPQAAVQMNLKAFKAGFRYAQEHAIRGGG
jgi:2-oxoglutarate ferredoxin oxidoreductase subunit beta